MTAGRAERGVIGQRSSGVGVGVPHWCSVAVAVAVAVGVMLMMVVMVMVMVTVVVVVVAWAILGPWTAYPRVRLQLRQAPSMQRSRVCPRGLQTGMREGLDDGLEILPGALGRPRQGHDEGFVPHASRRPGHHGNLVEGVFVSWNTHG